MSGKIAAIIDAGPTGGGIESTVLDCTVSPFRILRPGGVTYEELSSLVAVKDTLEGAPPAPGAQYGHYSPVARVVLVTGDRAKAEINRQIDACKAQGMKAALMAFTESRRPDIHFLDMGRDVSVAASRIYHLLRQGDALGLDVIIIEGLPEKGIGRTIMDRLRKAAAIVINT